MKKPSNSSIGACLICAIVGYIIGQYFNNTGRYHYLEHNRVFDTKKGVIYRKGGTEGKVTVTDLLSEEKK